MEKAGAFKVVLTREAEIAEIKGLVEFAEKLGLAFSVEPFTRPSWVFGTKYIGVKYNFTFYEYQSDEKQDSEE